MIQRVALFVACAVVLGVGLWLIGPAPPVVLPDWCAKGGWNRYGQFRCYEHK